MLPKPTSLCSKTHSFIRLCSLLFLDSDAAVKIVSLQGESRSCLPVSLASVHVRCDIWECCDVWFCCFEAALNLLCLWHIERKIRRVSFSCLKSQVAKGAPDRYYSNEHTRFCCCCFRPVDNQRGTGCCHSDLPQGVYMLLTSQGSV